MILQNFDLSQDDPNYQLKIKHLLTIKPQGFHIRAKLRHNRTSTDFHKSLRRAAAAAPAAAPAPTSVATATAPVAGNATVAATSPMPMTILYGSDTGTCEALAQTMAAAAAARGFAPKVAALNTAVGQLPQREGGALVVLICGTYHGRAAANAAEFVAWTETLEPGQLRGVEYAVLGLGHSDWTTTFYMTPILLDARLEQAGARRLAPLGKINTARADVFAGLESWAAAHLWDAVAFTGQQTVPDTPQDSLIVTLEPAATATSVPPPPPTRRNGFTTATVTKTRTLSGAGVAQKGHIELVVLPRGGDDAASASLPYLYEPGAHVQVLPTNDASAVQRALTRFQLSSSTVVSLRRKAGTAPPNTVLPLAADGQPLSLAASDLLTAFFDLSRAISPSNLELLIASVAADEDTKTKLAAMRAQTQQETQDGSPASGASILDILEQFPPSRLPLPFSTFLSMLPPMMPRTYSFSSSPAYMEHHHHHHARPEREHKPAAANTSRNIGTLTYGVVDRHQPGARNRGTCSHYLASLQPGDTMHISVTTPPPASPPAFRLPAGAERMATTPVIMIAAGTGIAPFMGFLQERAAHKHMHTRQQQRASNDNDGDDGDGDVNHHRGALAPALLFFGCRGRALDDLYRAELDAFERDGVVAVRRAYSREDGEYVADRLRACADEVVRAWDGGAVVYVCGAKGVADGVVGVLRPLLLEADRRSGRRSDDVDEDEAWVEVAAGGRYVVEVFA